MDFGKLLSRSWEIVWNNKFMFILGFLAALGAGGGGGGGNSGINFDDPSSIEGFENVIPQVEQFWTQYGALVIGLGCFLFLLGIIFWLLRLTAQAALIDTASRADNGEAVRFGSAFAAGRAKLGRMVGVNLLMFAPFFLIGLIFAVIVAGTVGTAFVSSATGATPEDFESIIGGAGILFACFGLLACLLVPVGLVVNLLYPFAQRGVVLGDMGVVDSIRHSWQVFRNNLGDIILLAVLFVVIGFVFGFAAAIVLIPFALLSAGPIIFQLIQGDSIGVGSIVFAVFGFIILGIIGAAINSILVTYRSTAVTLAYEYFIGKEAMSKTEFDPNLA